MRGFEPDETVLINDIFIHKVNVKYAIERHGFSTLIFMVN